MAELNGVSSDQNSSGLPPAHNTPPPSQPATTSINPSFPTTSQKDDGLSKKPRDARLIHMILANLGLTAYQERVPLQLMDFAYRYTSSTLQDAIHLTSESYGTTGPGAGGGGRGTGGNADLSSITLASLRLSVASRTHYQFSTSLPKEFYQEMAQDRNRVALPPVGRDWGVRLPPEKYCLTGVGWGLREEWDSDGEAPDEGGTEKGDEAMGDGDGEGNAEEEGDETMEDIFGESFEGTREDKEMGEGEG
ncbi:Transcription initiation factor TFIID subunit 9 [Loxospora ochrophaea]|nr:Transcription initiation factor TFIID subunit 9 [Loxospora ochrophaea]